MRFPRVLLLLTVLCGAASAQPFLDGDLAIGDTKLQGSYIASGASDVPTLKVFVCPKAQTQPCTTEVTVRTQFEDRVNHRFELTLVDPLDAAVLVSVEQTSGGVARKSNVLETPGKPAPVIRSAAAYWGSKSVAVHFDPVLGDGVSGSVTITTPLEKVTRKLTDAELKAGLASVSLDQRLIEALEYEATASMSIAKGGVAGTVNAPAAVNITRGTITLDRPIADASQEIHGRTYAGAKKVLITVLGASYSPPSSFRSVPASTLKSLTSSELLRPQLKNRTGNSSYVLQNLIGFMQDGTSRNNSARVLTTGLKPLDDIEARELAGDAFREVEQEQLKEVESGQFSVTLKHPVETGQVVIACEGYEGEVTGSQNCTRMTVNSSATDWGRVKLIFVAGAVVGRRDGNTKSDPYLGLYADIDFLNQLVKKTKLTSGGRPADSLFNRKFGMSVNGFVDLRLTQAAAVNPAANASAPSTFSAGFLSTGVYLPMRVGGMDWVHRGTQYTLYGAPLVKIGATSPKDGPKLFQKAGVDGMGKEYAPEVDSGVVPFYAYGARFGLLKLDRMMGTSAFESGDRNRQIAPDPQVYLDFTWGQDGLYRRPRIAPEGTVYDKGRVFWIEGRVKIPHVAAQIGFDILQFAARPQQASSDFRLIVATRIDINSVLAKLLPR